VPYTYTYPRPAVTADALVLARHEGTLRILLVRRLKDPFRGLWALPGGFANMEETLEHACLRELKEETGISLDKMEPFRVFDAVHRDPRHRTITVVFYAFLDETICVRGGDDASDARWFPLIQLPPRAFDNHDIIRMFTNSEAFSGRSSKFLGAGGGRV